MRQSLRLKMKRNCVNYHLLACLLFVVSALQVVQAVDTDRAFCRHYARDLITSPQQAQHTSVMCQKKQPHWNADKTHHTQWCLSVSKEEANKKRYRHNKLVNLCDDTYKLLMVDQHRVANPLLSEREFVHLEPASELLKNALLQDRLKSPYRDYYPVIYQAIKDKQLARCDLYSLAVSMDKKSSTKEWLLTLGADCLAGQKTAHSWLIQQLKDDYYVLFEGDANTLTLRYGEHHGYKNIAVSSRLRVNEENDKRCGSIKAEWHYVAGRYLPYKGEADEHGDCLPEYNLPDYLQGENTFRLSKKEWQQGMQEEEEKRIALFAPYKKSLEAYIPLWIARMEQQIPAIQSNVAGTSLLPTVADSNAHTSPTQKEKDKTFIQNLWEFLGFEP